MGLATGVLPQAWGFSQVECRPQALGPAFILGHKLALKARGQVPFLPCGHMNLLCPGTSPFHGPLPQA